MAGNKTIIKNSFFLYIRMIVVLIVTLYTSRLILQALGAEDFGIYNVIGGVVVMLAFLNSTLSSTCQRYFSNAIGINNTKKLQQLFSTIVSLYVLFILIVFIIGETIGLWFVNNKLIIPDDRIYAMNWVYQFTLLTIFASSLSVPFKSLIISNEKMSFFAYISIVEVVLKLILVFILIYISIDKLIAYAFLMFLVTTLITLSYYIVCRQNYKESRFHFIWNTQIIKEVGLYSGWHLFGALSVVIRNQGVNILLNTFFNPVVNAARAISFQVMTAVDVLTDNFFVAVKPQIYKLYSARKLNEMFVLLERSTKVCFLLVTVLALPVYFNIQKVLDIWLLEYPDITIIFTKLVLINAIIDSMNGPSIAAALATNKIKKFELITSVIMIFNLPLSYVLLRFGCNAEITVIVSIVLSLLTIIIRAWIIEGMISYKLTSFIKNVLLPITLTFVTSYLLIDISIGLFGDGDLKTLIVRLIYSFFVFVVVSFVFLLSRSEKAYVYSFVKSKL